ncbi:uncharacterized protein EDB91DRAFT_1349188 [Suillus paluster]|uniref:uncharacterized protein n=1 Tax=Suillus paluster TaxID=48578 RepID=UPI001B882CF5|nr:uncharacterized protein EDB91DRAFT_1349188 [Suillus paluster]KAG1731976.1 hypothetical protein EDB91DRAFT_1349188 [Suillus paluster]
MISTVMNATARVALSSLLTATFFKRTVIDHTVEVLSKAEKVSAGLIAYTVCSSSIMLVLASDSVAKKFLRNDAKYLPTPQDDAADHNPAFSDDTFTPATPQLAEFYCLPSPSTSLRLIESTDTIAALVTCSNTCISLTSPHSKYCLSPIDSNSSTTVFSDDASDTNDYESFGDDNTFHEDDFSVPKQTMLDTLVEKMRALTLDDLPRLSTLQPLILVANHQTASTSSPPSLLELATSMDALIRCMNALSLSDSPPDDPDVFLPDPDDALSRTMEMLSISDMLPFTPKLKPPIPVTKRAAAQLKFLPPTSTPSPQPTIKLTCDKTASILVPYDLELYRPKDLRPPPLNTHSHAHLRITHRRRWSPTTHPDDAPYHISSFNTVHHDPELHRLRSRRLMPVYPSATPRVYNASLGPLRPNSGGSLNGLLHRPLRPEVGFEGRRPLLRTRLPTRIAFRFILPTEVFLICFFLDCMRRTLDLSLACFFFLLFSFPPKRHL